MKNIKNILSCYTPGLLMIILLSVVKPSYSQVTLSMQPEKVQTRNGNLQYKTENYSDAEACYKKALDIKNNMPEATFNLGDAIYQQKRYDSAAKQFQLSAQTNTDPAVKAKAYHNLGNCYAEQKRWDDAVKAYKNALKINPNDADTRYNLAYANAMLQKNKSGGSQNNKDQNQKDKKDDKKQNQDKKDSKDQKQDKKQDQKQSDKQNQQNKQQQNKQQQQQPQQQKLSKEDADKLLQAVMNEEQKTTEKMQKKQMKAVRVKIKKDW